MISTRARLDSVQCSDRTETTKASDEEDHGTSPVSSPARSWTTDPVSPASSSASLRPILGRASSSSSSHDEKSSSPATGEEQSAAIFAAFACAPGAPSSPRVGEDRGCSGKSCLWCRCAAADVVVPEGTAPEEEARTHPPFCSAPVPPLLSFLSDARTLDSLARTCRFLHDVRTDPALWIARIPASKSLDVELRELLTIFAKNWAQQEAGYDVLRAEQLGVVVHGVGAPPSPAAPEPRADLPPQSPRGPLTACALTDQLRTFVVQPAARTGDRLVMSKIARAYLNSLDPVLEGMGMGVLEDVVDLLNAETGETGAMTWGSTNPIDEIVEVLSDLAFAWAEWRGVAESDVVVPSSNPVIEELAKVLLQEEQIGSSSRGGSDGDGDATLAVVVSVLRNIGTGVCNGSCTTAEERIVDARLASLAIQVLSHAAVLFAARNSRTGEGRADNNKPTAPVFVRFLVEEIFELVRSTVQNGGTFFGTGTGWLIGPVSDQCRMSDLRIVPVTVFEFVLTEKFRTAVSESGPMWVGKWLVHHVLGLCVSSCSGFRRTTFWVAGFPTYGTRSCCRAHRTRC